MVVLAFPLRVLGVTLLGHVTGLPSTGRLVTIADPAWPLVLATSLDASSPMSIRIDVGAVAGAAIKPWGAIMATSELTPAAVTPAHAALLADIDRLLEILRERLMHQEGEEFVAL